MRDYCISNERRLRQLGFSACTAGGVKAKCVQRLVVDVRDKMLSFLFHNSAASVFANSGCPLAHNDLLHLVHGDALPEDQLHAFLTWSSAARRETRPQRMHTDNHDSRLATCRDDDVNDGDNNNSYHRRKKLSNNERRSSPTSEHSGETPSAVTPNRWFLHGGVLSPRPRVTRDDVDSGSGSDGDGSGTPWGDERCGSQPSFDEYVDRPATKRHKYGSWYERLRHADSNVRDSDVTTHLSVGGVTEQHGNDVTEQLNITRHDDNDDDDDRQARSAHRRLTSPVDRRRVSACISSLRHHTHHHDVTATLHSPTHVDHCDTEDRQDLTAVPRSQPRSYSMSPMSPPRPAPPPFNVPSEFRPPNTAAPPLPPGPLSHEFVRHLREQQVLRLAAVSRAIQHQLRYLHHGGSGATSPSNSAGLYVPSHRQFDASLLLGAGAATPYSLHDSIIPSFRAADIALTSGRDSPGDSDISNDNASGVGLGTSLDRRKRSRVFIDPLTEIPRLERWFSDDTHPSAYTIEQYTDELNRAAYRQRFPPLEPKNVQLWFKNHRAKVKRQKLELQSTSIISGHPAAIACTDH